MLRSRFFPRHFRAIALLAIAASILFTGLGSARLWDRDEPRNVRCAEEMLARGDWVVPTFNDQLRDHKPVLLYWLQMASFLVFGNSEWSARLPSALLAIVTVFTVAVMGSRLAGERRLVSVTGFWSGAALATCLLFAMAGRAATPDSCLIVFSTIGIAALVLGSVRIDPASAISFSRRDGSATAASYSLLPVCWSYALVGYSSLGLAMLAKGPVGLVLPMIVVHGWWMLNQWNQAKSTGDWKNVGQKNLGKENLSLFGLGLLAIVIRRTFAVAWRSIAALRTIPGCCLSVLVAAPWYIEVGLATDGAFLRGFFLDHNLGRAVSSMEGHEGSILFYPIAFLVGTFPWSLWLIPIVLWAKLHRHRFPLAISLGAVWIFVYVGAFSLASTKLPSYITPCYPGAALIVGGYLRDFRLAQVTPMLVWRRTAGVLGVLVGSIVAIALPVAAWQLNMPAVGMAAIGGITLALFCCAALLQDRTNSSFTPVAWLAGATAFQISLFGVGAGLASRYRSDLDTLVRVQAERPASQWVCVGGLEPSWIYYLKQPIVEIPCGLDENSLVETHARLDSLVALRPDTNIIIESEIAERLLSLNVQPPINSSRSVQSSSRSVQPSSRSAQSSIHERLAPVEIARSERFLRPGSIAIFSTQSSDIASKSPATRGVRR